MDPAYIMIVLGALFFAGLVADSVGRRTQLPRVTLLLLCGVAAGGSGFNLIPAQVIEWFEFLSVIALTMVAFLLGGSFSFKNLRSYGVLIVAVSVSIVVFTALIVAAGLWALGFDPVVALLIGAIACATDPAATQDAIRQSGIKGRFPDALQGIVALDDAWGLMVFSLLMVVAGGLAGGVDFSLFGLAAWEILGAAGLGLVIGLPAAFLTGRLSGGEPMQAEALGLVFLTAGLSLLIDVSFLIAGMTVGAVIVNRAHHHRRAFHQIEFIQWPFMLLFFILAGASLEMGSLAEIGGLGAAYAVLRVLARLIGGWIGGWIGGAPGVERRWFGPALLPQAGVAVGMALVASKQFPEFGSTILQLTIGSTVLFELIGPSATLFAVRRVERAEREAGSGA